MYINKNINLNNMVCTERKKKVRREKQERRRRGKKETQKDRNIRTEGQNLYTISTAFDSFQVSHVPITMLIFKEKARIYMITQSGSACDTPAAK